MASRTASSSTVTPSPRGSAAKPGPPKLGDQRRNPHRRASASAAAASAVPSRPASRSAAASTPRADASAPASPTCRASATAARAVSSAGSPTASSVSASTASRWGCIARNPIRSASSTACRAIGSAVAGSPAARCACARNCGRHRAHQPHIRAPGTTRRPPVSGRRSHAPVRVSLRQRNGTLSADHARRSWSAAARARPARVTSARVAICPRSIPTSPGRSHAFARRIAQRRHDQVHVDPDCIVRHRIAFRICSITAAISASGRRQRPPFDSRHQPPLELRAHTASSRIVPLALRQRRRQAAATSAERRQW